MGLSLPQSPYDPDQRPALLLVLFDPVPHSLGPASGAHLLGFFTFQLELGEEFDGGAKPPACIAGHCLGVADGILRFETVPLGEADRVEVMPYPLHLDFVFVEQILGRNPADVPQSVYSYSAALEGALPFLP